MLAMRRRGNQLEGYRRCFSGLLVGLMTLMFWLSADAAAHRQLHAFVESAGELHGGADCDHESDPVHGEGEDHCAITLFPQGKMDSSADSITGFRFEPVLVEASLIIPETEIQCPAWQRQRTGPHSNPLPGAAPQASETIRLRVWRCVPVHYPSLPAEGLWARCIEDLSSL